MNTKPTRNKRATIKWSWLDKCWGEKYYFVFNDLNDATLAYQFKLNASLTDKKSDIILCTLKGEEPEKEVDFLKMLG